jgi:ribose transport system substrate-binding protein
VSRFSCCGKVRYIACGRLAIACALFASAVSAGAQAATLGVSMHFMRDDYAVKVIETIESIAATHPDSKVIVTDANANPAKQLADFENLVAQEVDAIIVIPIDEKAIRPGIRRANAIGIPVITITYIPDAEVVTTIAANGDYANGKASGLLLREQLDGVGNIAIIGVPYNLWRIDERVRGLEDALAGSDIAVVARQASDDQAKVQDLVSGILISHPDLDGIWCTFSNQIVAAADALRVSGRKDIVLTGVDADLAIIERIKQGWVTGAAAQFPAEHGRLAAEAAFSKLAGKPVSDTYEVPVGLVTAENADEMSVRIWGE